MSNDIGVVNNDDDDLVPDSPLDSIIGITPVRTKQRKVKLLKNFDSFNPDLKVQERIEKRRDSWWGKIFDPDKFTLDGVKKYYEVQLQDGQFVQAYCADQTDEHEWKDYQRVQVIFDGTDYVILTPPNKRNIYLWWEAIETLHPGSTAKGKIRYYDNDTELFKDNSSEVTVKDTEHRNFVLRGERIQIRINEETYEPIGSSGLRRKAVLKTLINANSSGSAYIYVKGVKAKEPYENSDRDVEVTVHLDWAHNNKPFNTGSAVFLTYFPEDEKWTIDGGEC